MDRSDARTAGPGGKAPGARFSEHLLSALTRKARGLASGPGGAAGGLPRGPEAVLVETLSICRRVVRAGSFAPGGEGTPPPAVHDQAPSSHRRPPSEFRLPRITRVGDGLPGHDGPAPGDRSAATSAGSDRSAGRIPPPLLHSLRRLPIFRSGGATVEPGAAGSLEPGSERTARLHPRQHGSLQVDRQGSSVGGERPVVGLFRVGPPGARSRHAGQPV